jgi:Peptidase M15
MATTLRLGDRGPAVKKLQAEIDETLRNRDFRSRTVRMDGRFGEKTQTACHFTGWLLGFSPSQLHKIRDGEITAHAYAILVHEEARSDPMKKRERERRQAIKNAQRPVRSLKKVSISGSAGAPHWGGSGDVLAQFVEPFMVRRELPIGSGKRTPAENRAVGGSANSDHLTTKLTTGARDFPTFVGEDDARALARAMGNSRWVPNSFESFNIGVGGHDFRVQILWGSRIRHGDHVHVGIMAL